ncbi:MAG: penicillin-binding protein 2 [Spirochaeta sp.]|nr:penicillin-binding protein 2 [Spirochaeta sp.]
MSNSHSYSKRASSGAQYSGQRSRGLVFGAVVTLFFLGYLGHLFSLQVIEGQFHATRALSLSRRGATLAAPRGEIFDRHADKPIAGNRTSFTIQLNPARVPNGQHAELFSDLAELLDVPVAQLNDRVPPSSYHIHQEIDVLTWAKMEKVTHLAEHIHEFPGVSWITTPVRTYPESETMAHLLGHVGRITSRELQVLYNEGYHSSSILGKSGIEQQYDQQLQGIDGRRIGIFDAHGRSVTERETEIVPPEPGDNLVLTVDRHIQQLAAEALGERLGSVVVLKPNTGEILAMVSYPSFDPNTLYGRQSNSALAQLQTDDRAPFLNRAVQSSYPPASTFKILLTAAALEEDLIGPDDIIYAHPVYRIGNRVVREWRPNGFGSLNITQALANSSNVFFATLGNEYIGTDLLLSYATEFGFGALTGIDLPGERAGVVPSREWKQNEFNTAWVQGDTVNISIGQGFLDVTPLQLANMVALLVNDGRLYRPHLLKEVRDGVDGTVLGRVEPEVIAEVGLSQDTLALVRGAMREVVRSGTASSVITTPSVAIAGKTGTAEVDAASENWHSWFVAYGPYDTDNPDEQVVVAVMVEAENKWEWWAPRAANVIFHGIFSDMSYEESRLDLQQRRLLW